MLIQPPYPKLEEYFTEIGEVGARLSELNCCEGSSGNISVCFNWPCEPDKLLSEQIQVKLPVFIPKLAGFTLIVTGSGCRLPEIYRNPARYLCIVQIHADGKTGSLFRSPQRCFEKPTSEFNSHLASHCQQIVATGANFHALVHTHPPYLTFLSNIPTYQNAHMLTRRVLCWQPEMITHIPEGLGWVPFCVPGSDDLMNASLNALKTNRVIVWAKHGIVARSEIGLKNALDLIEFTEAGARYEFFNLASGGQGEGLLPNEIGAICDFYHFEQNII